MKEKETAAKHDLKTLYDMIKRLSRGEQKKIGTNINVVKQKTSLSCKKENK